ncbi:CpaF family protein [Desulfoglaeba alkanexedens]|uniref:CpaF family protein n=1 Tax=Desulfoglaeba alkanexedens ALDC TaxID=980445 RepID=A0A4P8L4V2_9BACT|nr:CpaF family protein [Desulfoglaeba alkanexedens]QCQ22969.1 CpaF family protein [Desulfoglaeba alkanexedens ALDC]
MPPFDHQKRIQALNSNKPSSGIRRLEKYLDRSEYHELKTRVHHKLVETLDLSLISSEDRPALLREINRLTEEILAEEGLPLSSRERERFFREIQDEVFGLGPLEPFLQDPTVSDILVNSHKQVYVERFGRLELTDARFKDDAHLMTIIEKIVADIGRRVDESSPMVDARLPDGSRVNAIIPPLALDGPVLSIRRFAVDPLKMDDLIAVKTCTPEVAELLEAIVAARLNVVISGGTGTGKTTLLNVLSRYISNEERIITIEDSAELQLQQDHVVRLETRPPNLEGRGEITQRHLVKNSLRMRPDRIIIGEVRGDEALDMLQAMNTGHDGSLTTIHANSPRDALTRLETMVSMTGYDIPVKVMRHYIASALDVLIQLSRFSDGSRKVTSIQEITGIEEELITMQEIFSFKQQGITADGKVKGVFRFTGIRPNFMDKIAMRGIELPYNFFDPTKIYEV